MMLFLGVTFMPLFYVFVCCLYLRIILMFRVVPVIGLVGLVTLCK